ncbi:MAG: nucleotide exchange factor GrpE [Planctomycetota bacterium]
MGETEGEEAEGPDEETSPKYENELQETKANWQRALADYQNLKKRILSDTEQEVKRVKIDMLSQLLLTLDYLEMALASPAESQETKNLLAGVEMTRNQMVSFLENQGASPIESEGQFDPALHQAFETVEDAEREPGQIVKTVRRGFSIGEDVLRHAQVVVVKENEPEESAAEEA